MRIERTRGIQILYSLVMGIIGIAMLLGGGLFALQTFATALHPAGQALENQTTVAYNATTSTMTALATVPTWLTIIIPVGGIVAVLSMFALFQGKKGR